jgi:hypothetical protein
MLKKGGQGPVVLEARSSQKPGHPELCHPEERSDEGSAPLDVCERRKEILALAGLIGDDYRPWILILTSSSTVTPS